MPEGSERLSDAVVEEKHAVWVDAGLPVCHNAVLYVYEATDAERTTYCQGLKDSCLLPSVATSLTTSAPLAVISPEYPDGWVHELWHSFETCSGWEYDKKHEGPQWQEPRKAAGIP
jgi:hypothetical protein